MAPHSLRTSGIYIYIYMYSLYIHFPQMSYKCMNMCLKVIFFFGEISSCHGGEYEVQIVNAIQ
jgi:hypothetical protein